MYSGPDTPEVRLDKSFLNLYLPRHHVSWGLLGVIMTLLEVVGEGSEIPQ